MMAQSPKIIRVVDTKRKTIDIATAAPEELRALLEALVSEFEPSEHQAIFAIERIASNLRDLGSRCPAGSESLFGGPLIAVADTQRIEAEMMDEVALRQLLYSEAVIPSLPEIPRLSPLPGPPAGCRLETEHPAGRLRVRPGVRKQALAPSALGKSYQDIAIAAEQPIAVEGLAFEPENQGELLIQVFAGGIYPGLRALIDSGAYSAPVLSVAVFWHGGLRPAAAAHDESSLRPAAAHDESSLRSAAAHDESSRRPAAENCTWRGRHIRPYTPKLVRNLRGVLSSSLAFHLSGAGAYLALMEALRLAPKRSRPRPGGVFADTIVRTPAQPAVPPGSMLRRFIARLVEAFIGNGPAASRGGESITAAPEEFVFSLTPLLDIYRVGALGAYYYALTEGLEAPGVQRFLERVAIARTEAAQHAVLDRGIFIDTARARHYAIIIEDKFGAKKLQDVIAALHSEKTDAGNPQALLNHLGGAARKIVETEFENRKAEWEAQVNNRCPHIRLTYRLRAATSAREATKILQELSGYYQPAAANPGELGWILCKGCGFRAICPHVNELIQMEARNLPYDTISTRLMKYSVKYSDGGQSSNYYFCRICSEMLAEFAQEDRTAEFMGAMGGLDGHIKKIIWAEAMNAAQLVRFPTPVDPRQFAATAVDLCYPLILISEEATLRRGRRGGGRVINAADPFDEEEGVDPRTRLYIAVFVHAYVLNLIRSSSEFSNRRIGFENVRADASIATYAEALLTTILRKHAGRISQIEDISPEFIANRFREAYSLIIGEKGAQVLASADVAKDVVSRLVTLSPVYHYIATAARVFGVIPIGRPSTPEEARREFETVFGRPLPEILGDQTTDPKAKALQVMLGVRPTARGARRVVVEYPRGADPLYIFGRPEVNFLYKMLRVPDSFERGIAMGPLDGAASLTDSMPACLPHGVLEMVGGGFKAAATGEFLRANPLLARLESGLFLDTYRIFTEYSVGVVDASTMETYLEHLAEARRREQGYLFFRAAASVKNFHQFGFTVSRRFGRYADPAQVGSVPVTPVALLTYLYDENGHRHTWAKKTQNAGNIYVYSSGAELSADAIIESISTRYKAGDSEGPIYGQALLDIRCAVCGVLRSKTHTLDPRKAAESLKAVASFDAFFSFYASRCPSGDLHAFQKKICGKCGLAEVLIFGHKSPGLAAPARAYYDKFLGGFRKQQHAAAGSIDGIFQATRPPSSADLRTLAREKYQTFTDEWKADYSFLIRAAELAEAPVAAFETLGATEGRLYADVLSGLDAPPPPSTFDDPRLLAVDSDVRVFTTNYNRLRFVNLAPPEVEILLEEAQIQPQELEALAPQLPEVFDDYNLKRLALTQRRGPGDVLLFSIEALARMALAVAGANALGKAFARRELREIVRSERLLAKNGPFSFKIFGEEDIGGGTLGNAIEGLDDYDAAGDEVGGHGPFSLEEVDIDENSPNLESN